MHVNHLMLLGHRDLGIVWMPYWVYCCFCLQVVDLCLLKVRVPDDSFA